MDDRTKADRHDTRRVSNIRIGNLVILALASSDQYPIVSALPRTCLGTRALKLTQLRTLKNRSDCTISLQREPAFCAGSRLNFAINGRIWQEWAQTTP